MKIKKDYIVVGIFLIALFAAYSAKRNTQPKDKKIQVALQSEPTSRASVSMKSDPQEPQHEVIESASLNINARAEQEVVRDARNVNKFEERVRAEYRQIVSKQYTRSEFNDLSNKVMSQSYLHPEDLMAAYLDLRNKILLSSTNRAAQDEMLSSLDKKYGAKSEKMDKLQYNGFGIESKGDRFVLKMNR